MGAGEVAARKHARNLHRMGGRFGVAVVSALGLSSTLVAIACALVPPVGADKVIFYTKVLGGCAAFVGLGWALFAGNRPRLSVAFAPAPPSTPS